MVVITLNIIYMQTGLGESVQCIIHFLKAVCRRDDHYEFRFSIPLVFALSIRFGNVDFVIFPLSFPMHKMHATFTKLWSCFNY